MNRTTGTLFILLTVGLSIVTPIQYVYSQEYTRNTCEFGGRVGRVIVKNDSMYPITVKLYHSDNGQIQSTERVNGGEAVDFGYNVGDSWGIQIGGSKVKCVGDISEWRNNTFYVNTSTFYDE